MQITRKSMMTGEIHTLEIPVTEDQLQRWSNGELIQNAMPNVSKEHREFIISGITPEEWRKTFGTEA